jgi:hypothetical protein
MSTKRGRPVIHITPESKAIANRNYFSKHYYKKQGLILENAREQNKKRTAIRQFIINNNTNTNILYDFIISLNVPVDLPFEPMPLEELFEPML